VAYVVTATWKARAGEDAAVEALLGQVAAASREEPGCILFWTHRSVDQPGRFFLYEQYASEAAFQAHAASEHVRRFVLEDAVHRLDERRREMYETLDA
jgi:quinol monooxygenase YgiN